MHLHHIMSFPTSWVDKVRQTFAHHGPVWCASYAGVAISRDRLYMGTHFRTCHLGNHGVNLAQTWLKLVARPHPAPNRPHMQKAMLPARPLRSRTLCMTDGRRRVNVIGGATNSHLALAFRCRATSTEHPR